MTVIVSLFMVLGGIAAINPNSFTSTAGSGNACCNVCCVELTDVQCENDCGCENSANPRGRECCNDGICSNKDCYESDCVNCCDDDALFGCCSAEMTGFMRQTTSGKADGCCGPKFNVPQNNTNGCCSSGAVNSDCCTPQPVCSRPCECSCVENHIEAMTGGGFDISSSPSGAWSGDRGLLSNPVTVSTGNPASFALTSGFVYQINVFGARGANAGTHAGGNGAHMRMYIDRTTTTGTMTLSRTAIGGGSGAGAGGQGIQITGTGINIVAGGGGGAGHSTAGTTGNGAAGAGGGGAGGTQTGQAGQPARPAQTALVVPCGTFSEGSLRVCNGGGFTQGWCGNHSSCTTIGVSGNRYVVWCGTMHGRRACLNCVRDGRQQHIMPWTFASVSSNRPGCGAVVNGPTQGGWFFNVTVRHAQNAQPAITESRRSGGGGGGGTGGGRGGNGGQAGTAAGAGIATGAWHGHHAGANTATTISWTVVRMSAHLLTPVAEASTQQRTLTRGVESAAGAGAQHSGLSIGSHQVASANLSGAVQFFNGTLFAGPTGTATIGTNLMTARVHAANELRVTAHVHSVNRRVYVYIRHSLNHATQIRVPIVISTNNNAWASQSPATINGHAVTHAGATGATRTITVTNPIPIQSTLTIAATNLFTDADAVDAVVITDVQAATPFFSRTMAGSGIVAGTYNSLTITSLQPAAATQWHRLTFTLRNIERATGGHAGPSGVHLNRTQFATQTVHVDFRTGNVRPFYRGDTRFTGTIPANTGDVNDVFVNLSRDGSNGPSHVDIPINALAHSSTARTFNTDAGVVLPQNEWFPRSTEGDYIGGNMRAGSIFGGRGTHISSAGPQIPNAQACNGQALNRPTGFAGNEHRVRPHTSPVNPDGVAPPWITWQFTNTTTLRITANSASRNLFDPNRIGGTRGHFYILVRINCPNDTADGGIWMPVLVQVNLSDTGPGTGNGDCTEYPCDCDDCRDPGGSIDLGDPNDPRISFDAEGNPIAYITPFGVGMRPVGASNNLMIMPDGGWPFPSAVVAPLNNRSFALTNNTNDLLVANPAFPSGVSAPFAAMRTDPFLIDHRDGTITMELINGLQSNIYWYTVEIVDFFVLLSIFDLLPQSERNNLFSSQFVRPIVGTDLAVIRGFRITGRRATLDNTLGVFVEFGANTILTRSFEHTNNPPASQRWISRGQIAVPNRGPQAVGTIGEVGAGLDNFAHSRDMVGTIPRFRFDIYHGDQFVITPWDLARDIDANNLPHSHPHAAARANPITRDNSSAHSATHQQAINAANRQISVRASNTATAAVNTRSMRLDTLYFGAVLSQSGTGVASIERIQGGAASFDHMQISAIGHNPSFGLQARIQIRDRVGATIEVYIYVRVNNSPPRLHPGIANSIFFLTAGVETAGRYNRMEFTFDQLMFDPDPGHDMPRIVPGSISIMTRQGFNGPFISLPNGESFVRAFLDQGTGANLGHAEVLHIVAESATIGLRYGLYVQFEATDQAWPYPASDFLRIRVEVIDSPPVIDRSRTTDSGLPGVFGTDVQDWVVEGRGTIGQDRFITSDDDLGLWLTSRNRPQPNPNLFFTAAQDPDSNHGVIPIAASLNLNTTPTHRRTYATSAGNTDGGSSPANAVWATLVNDAETGFDNPGNFTIDGNDHIELQWFERISGGFQQVMNPSPTVFHTLYWAVVIRTQGRTGDVIVNLRLTAANEAVVYGGTFPLGFTGGIGSPDFSHAGGVRTPANNNAAPINTIHSVLRVRVSQAENELRNNFAYFGINGEYFVEEEGTTNVFSDGFYFTPVTVPTAGFAQIPLSFLASFEDQQRDPALNTRGIGFYQMTTSANNQGNVNFGPSNATQLLSNFRVEDARFGTSWSGADIHRNPFVTFGFNTSLQNPRIFTGDNAPPSYINRNMAGTPQNRWVVCPGIDRADGAPGVHRAEGWFIEDRLQFNMTKNRMRTNQRIYVSVDLAIWTLQAGNFHQRVPGTRITVRFPVHVDNSAIEIGGGTAGQNLNGLNANPSRPATGNLTTWVGNNITPIMLSTQNATVSGGWDLLPTGGHLDTAGGVMFRVTDRDNINTPATPVIARNDTEALRYRDTAMFSAGAINWSNLNGCNHIDCGSVARGSCCERGRLINFARGNTDQAQRVRSQFFGAANVAELNDIIASSDFADFNPNWRAEEFFSLTPGADTPLLNLTPRRKTALNMEILEYELANAIPAITTPQGINDFVRRNFGLNRHSDGRFYFPLTLIAYDTFDGSGFMNASFDVVQVNVFIENTPLRVNNMTMTTGGSGHIINNNAYVKTIRMFATGEQTSQTINLADILADEDTRIHTAIDGERTLYTGQMVRNITGSDPMIAMLERLTTDYVGQIDVRNVTPANSLSGVPMVNPRVNPDPAIGNSLVTYYITSGDNPGPIGGIGAVNPELGPVTRYTLGSQFIRFQAHARLPVLGPNEPSAQFRMQFLDNASSDGQNLGVINTILFNIIIMNAPPTVRPEAEQFRMPGQEIVMRSGDSFTVLTTPYSRNNDPSIAAGRYATDPFGNMIPGELVFSDGIGSNSVNRFPHQMAGRDSSMAGWSYNDLDMPFVRNFEPNDPSNRHLGFLPVFTDDTPWALRFNTQAGFLSYDNQVFNRSTFNYMYLERVTNTQGQRGAPTAITFQAHGAHPRTPITLVVFDEVADSMASFTFYVTVVSSPPRPILPSSDRELHPDIELYYASAGNDFAIFTTEIDLFNNVEFSLYHMAYDIDTGDTPLMFFGLFDGIGAGSRFMMRHSGSSSSDFIPQTTGDFVSITMLSHNTFRLHAHNFEANSTTRPFTAIRMMVMDPSDITVGYLLIELRVFIRVAEFGVSPIQNFEVKSVFEYENRHIAPAYRPATPIVPSLFQLIGRPGAVCAFTGNAPIFFDNDFGAISSSYTVNILSMRRFNEMPNGSLVLDRIYELSDMNRIWNDNTPEGIAYRNSLTIWNGSSTNSSNRNAHVWRYIDINEFDVRVIDGVPAIVMVPRMGSNIINGQVMGVELWISISKDLNRSYDGGMTFTTRTRNTIFNFSVRNSPLLTIGNTGSNFTPDGLFTTFSGHVTDHRYFPIINHNMVNDQALFRALDGNDFVDPENVTVTVTDVFKLNPPHATVVPFSSFIPRILAENYLTVRPVRQGDFYSLRVDINRKPITATLAGLPTHVQMRVSVVNNSGEAATADITVVINNHAPEFTTSYIHRLPNNVSLSEEAGVLTMNITLTTNVLTQLNLADFVRDVDWGLGRDYIRFVSPDWAEVCQNQALTHFSRNYPLGVLARPMFTARVTRIDNAVLELLASDNWNRGDTSVTYLRIADSFGAQTDLLRIRVVIGNDAPVQILDPISGNTPRNNLHVLGRNEDSGTGSFVAFGNINILDHVADRNPSDHAEITVDNRFAIRLIPITLTYEVASARYISTGLPSSSPLIQVEMDNNNLQGFRIWVNYGLFGSQSFRVAVRDGTTYDETPDAHTIVLEFTVNVTRSPEYSPTVGTIEASYRVRTLIDIERLFDTSNDHDGGGVEAHSFQMGPVGSNDAATSGEGFTLLGLRLAEPTPLVRIYRNNEHQTGVALGEEGDVWHVEARNERNSAFVYATIGIEGQGHNYTFERRFTLNNVINLRPFLLPHFNNTTFIIMESEMNNRVIRFHSSEIFGDPEDDYVRFLGVSSRTRAVVTAAHLEETNEIMLTFNGRGASQITIEHTDVTNRVYTAVITVQNFDLPQLNFFARIGASMQTNVWLYVFILIFVILLLIALIILISVLRRRRRIREEVEALLVAELELEEKMLMLAASSSEHTYYQSHGYLPPPVQTDPNFMLGYGGGEMPANPSVMLNQGQGNHHSTTRFTETRTVTEHNVPNAHDMPAMDDYNDDLGGL